MLSLYGELYNLYADGTMSSTKFLYFLLLLEMKKGLYNAKCQATLRSGSGDRLLTVIFSDEQALLIPSRLHWGDYMGSH